MSNISAPTSSPLYTLPLIAAVSVTPMLKDSGRSACNDRDGRSGEVLAPDPFNFHHQPLIRLFQKIKFITHKQICGSTQSSLSLEDSFTNLSFLPFSPFLPFLPILTFLYLGHCM